MVRNFRITSSGRAAGAAATGREPLMLRFLVRLLKPVARLCLRHSIRIQSLLECLKVAFVEAASEQLEAKGEKVTTSRLSVMTGIHRRDIDRIGSGEVELEKDLGLVTKIVGQWQLDKRFLTKKGQPRVLVVNDEKDEFAELVHAVSRELNPATVLFELERTKTIRATAKGIELLRETYSSPDRIEDGLSILADDAGDLIEAVDENLHRANEVPNLHARTVFDNVRSKDLPKLRKWLLQEGHELHKKARNFLAQFDQDINPDTSFSGKSVKVVLGSFSRIETDEDSSK